ncbi:bacteriocin leader domain-containing protein [Lentilactobacillus parafarraginis]|uniref:Bacteriocin leader domain-containing protein n=1 Tax=Lentilactobacillus parafarraginis TaxID=390842 RepID=A0A5R9CHA4_9LACO|nr:bacteriocin leader domain-containing protein [Lentilactobacillus parafarraginis]
MFLIKNYTNVSPEVLASIIGGKYRGPNYRCLIKSGSGLIGGALSGIPGGAAGVVGLGTVGLVYGAVSCLRNP